MASTNTEAAPKNTKPVVQSPPNDPQAPDGEQVDRDNEDSRERDREDTDEQDAREGDPVQRAVSGSNAGLDNDPSRLRANAPRREERRPTANDLRAQAGDSAEGDAITGQPGKMDSFGGRGDVAAPRPQMTPDLAEPLRDPANVRPQSAGDAGETTARLHASMRATGARQYGLLETSPGAYSGMGEITDPHQALELIRTKTDELQETVDDGDEQMTDEQAQHVEHLLAEIKYLLGVARRR